MIAPGPQHGVWEAEENLREQAQLRAALLVEKVGRLARVTLRSGAAGHSRRLPGYTGGYTGDWADGDK